MSSLGPRKGVAWLAALATAAVWPAACGDVTSDLIMREGIVDGGSEALCADDTDCPSSTPRCEQARDRCVECLASVDCPNGEVCSLPAGTCVPRCADSSACPLSSPVCERTTGLCRRCGSDAECSPTSRPFCSSTSGRCDECREPPLGGPAPDCTTFDRPFCEEGRCVECENEGHCGAGEDCSKILGLCAVACGDAGCPADDPICDQAIGFCVECRDDRDCEPGELCANSECTR